MSGFASGFERRSSSGGPGIPSRALRVTALLALVLSSQAAVGGPAVAAPPTNDDVSSPTVVSSLPFTDSTSTVEATTASDDPECAGGGHTVWYSFTPRRDMRITAHTRGSSFDTTLSAYTTGRRGLEQVGCNDDLPRSVQSRLTLDLDGGQTYLFMAGSFGESPGGDLQLSIRRTPRAFSVMVDVDRKATVNSRTGMVTVSGTVTCSRRARGSSFGLLEQRVGRLRITGFFDGGRLRCRGATPWSAELEGENGRFGGGRASLLVQVFLNPNRGRPISVSVQRDVRLSGSRR